MAHFFKKGFRVVLWVSLYLLKMFTGFSQGIEFRESVVWEKVLQLSKNHQQLIFVDIYTDWCGPCKEMDARVFSLEEVGAFFNSNFINVKINAEKGQGIELAKKYNVRVFPTYLFLNEEGELVSRKNGSMPADYLIELGFSVLNESNSDETAEEMKKQYPTQKNDKTFMFRYLRALTKIQLPVATLMNDYFELLTEEEKTYPENLQLVLDNGIFSNNKIILGTALDALLANDTIFALLKKPAYNPTQKMIAEVALQTSLEFAILHKDSILMKTVWEKAPDKDSVFFDNREEMMLDYYFQTEQKELYEKNAISYIEHHLMNLCLKMMDSLDKKVYEEQLQYVADNREKIIKRSGEHNVSLEYLSMYKRTQTIQLLNTINLHTERLIKGNASADLLKKAKKWSEFIILQAETDTAYYHKVLPYYKMLSYEIHYLSGRKKNSVKKINTLIESVTADAYLVKTLEGRKQKLIQSD